MKFVEWVFMERFEASPVGFNIRVAVSGGALSRLIADLINQF